jgi:hypothetical protein
MIVIIIVIVIESVHHHMIHFTRATTRVREAPEGSTTGAVDDWLWVAA